MELAVRVTFQSVNPESRIAVEQVLGVRANHIVHFGTQDSRPGNLLRS
jgi:hypothetical protein